ncbi:MAG: heme exporter protein CcmD [Methylococcaceae bacterium]|nr:heme exporter protein CcmD [Methylococcaceae bacterium]
MSLQDFLSMGGYAQFVWPSYGLVMVVLIVNFVIPIRRQAEIEQNLKRARRQAGGGLS